MFAYCVTSERCFKVHVEDFIGLEGELNARYKIETENYLYHEEIDDKGERGTSSKTAKLTHTKETGTHIVVSNGGMTSLLRFVIEHELVYDH